MSSSKEEFDPELIARVVRDQMRKEKSEANFALSEEYTPMLTRLYAEFTRPGHFKPGDIVKWRDGLQNKSIPIAGSVGIVAEVLDTPFEEANRDAGSQYFREPLDLAVACIVGEEKQFAIYWFDSRRFTVVEPPTVEG